MPAFQGLNAGTPIVDANGAPTAAFLLYMQQITSGITNSSGATMPAPADVNVYADYTGAYLAGQLPRVVGVQRLLNGDDVSGRSRWFVSTLSGTITATIDQTGIITITALGANSVLQIKSVRDGVTLTCNLKVSKVIGTPPTAGGSGGGAASSVSAFSTINTVSHVPITGELSCTVGSSGTVTLNAPLTVITAEAAPGGVYPVWGKWQWWNGSAYVDVAAEVVSSPSATVTHYNSSYDESDGALTVNTSKTGLTTGSTAKFQLCARNGSGSRAMNFVGTASVIP